MIYDTNNYVLKITILYICVCWQQIFLNASFTEDQGELSIDYFPIRFFYRTYLLYIYHYFALVVY